MNPISAANIRPNSWLRELARSKPAKWQWNRSIRAAICIALPLGFGVLSGQMALGVWMSIASLMVTSSENNGSYHSRLKAVAISTGIGSLGCLVGYAGVLPWGWVVLIMAALSVLAGIISSYGAPFSSGMLQFLALAAVAIGRPQIGPFWEPMLYFIAGAAFYALMMALEALLLRLQPRRQMATDLVNALAKLSLARAALLQQESPTRRTHKDSDAAAEDSNTAVEDNHAAVGGNHAAMEDNRCAIEVSRRAIEDSRRTVTSLQSALYADILGRHARKAGRTSEIDSLWALLQSSDTVFAAILSSVSQEQLKAAADDLYAIATAIVTGKKLPDDLKAVTATHSNTPLSQAMLSMASVKQWSHSPFSRIISDSAEKSLPHKPRLALLRDRLLPGKETLRSAVALGLCVAVSYAAHWFDKDTRWYWIPLTVAIVMKPDFGSIFARSLARTAGTLIGALLGTVILILLPKGLGLVALIAILAGLIPWAAQRSYATLGIVITPLVLVLIDLTVPGTINVNYGGQRLLGTAIGAGIVLIFGYFIWPRTHSKEISANFQRANRTLAAYLLATVRRAPAEVTQDASHRANTSDSAQTVAPLPAEVTQDTSHRANTSDSVQTAAPPAGVTQAAVPLPKLRRNAYAKLTDLRIQLQKTMAEPPPAGTEATAWLPIVASAERICDFITAYSVQAEAEAAATGDEAIRHLAAAIAAAPDNPPQNDCQTACAGLPLGTAEFIHKVTNELRFISRSTDSTAADTNVSQTPAQATLKSPG